MAKTVGIAVGCAGAYIILVVGLMIYCKGRRARQAKNKLGKFSNGDHQWELKLWGEARAYRGTFGYRKGTLKYYVDTI